MALGRMITGFITVIVGASLVPTLVVVVNSSITGLTDTITGSDTDAGLTLTNASDTTLGIISTQSSASCSDLVLINATGGETINAGNYTFDTSACTFILGDDSSYIAETGNASYDYSYDTLTGTSGSSASLLELTILFFALGVMIAGVGTSVSGLVEYGLV